MVDLVHYYFYYFHRLYRFCYRIVVCDCLQA